MRWSAAANCAPPQFGGRGIWRVRKDDLIAYIEGAFDRTAERMAPSVSEN